MNKQHNQVRTGSALIALVSEAEARQLAIMAAPDKIAGKKTGKPVEFVKKYCDANAKTIYVLCNTWLLLINEKSERTCHMVRESLFRFGLTHTIKVADELANAIVHEESNLSDAEGYPVWFDCLVKMADDLEAKRKVIELLRFPKRYSPAYQDDVLSDGIVNFLAVNKTRRFRQQQPSVDSYTPCVKHDDCYVMQDVYKVVKDVLRGTIFEEIAGLSPAKAEARVLALLNEGFFSNGATAEFNAGRRYLLNKLRSLRDKMPYYKDIHYPWSDNRRLFYPWDMCEAKAVPKSFKTPRIIAKEPTWRNFICSALRVILIRQLKELNPTIWQYITVEDQDPNRDLCWEASVGGRLPDNIATIDISSASDSISAGVGCGCFPIFAKVPWLRSSYMRVGDETYYCNIFLTSGHPLTFICETIFYYAVAVVSTKYTQLWYDKRYKFAQPRVFGDDVEIDWRAFDMFVSLTEILGIKVNVDKSFTKPSNYRESCGVEYLHGYPMHGLKWPRTTFDWSEKQKGKIPDYLESLVQLQHGVYPLSWKASQFLTSFILKHEPLMTFSKPYTYDTVDLWSEMMPIIRTLAPSKDLDPDWASQHEDVVMREVHAVLRPQYVALPSALIAPELELALYVDFLISGPVYATELDRLLKVSEPVARKPLACVPHNRWVTVRS